MTKMQERLNVTELETSSSSNQLSQLQIENNNLSKENEELLASAKVSAAENERLKAELDQNKLENDRIREEIQIREDKLEAEKKVDEEKQTEEKTEDQSEDKENNASYNLVSALEQELRIVSRINYGFDFQPSKMKLFLIFQCHSSNEKKYFTRKMYNFRTTIQNKPSPQPTQINKRRQVC